MVERGNGPNLLTMPACGAMLWPDLQATAREAKNLENDSKKSFGEFITQRRRALGLTQREFADKLFVTNSAVSKWERGVSLR